MLSGAPCFITTSPSDAPGASLGEPDDLNSDTVDPSVSGDGVTGAIDEENPGR